jgi:DNA topoisomerase IB
MTDDDDTQVYRSELEAAVAAEREKVAAWMIERSYATGHGDTTENLLKELEWQIRESEREACAKLCDEYARSGSDHEASAALNIQDAIRARGETK